MLKCYLDDSGTHNGSSVIVWGGVAGDRRFFDKFETAWKNQLKSPCDNKPPIKVFHSSALAAGTDEFSGYSQAERDRTRYNFRKIITDTGLTWMSYGISIKAWENVIPTEIGQSFGAETLVFGSIIRDYCKSAKNADEPIFFLFDQGRSSQQLNDTSLPAFDVSEIGDQHVDYDFASVKINAGLQAADLVAHETYQYFTKYIDDCKTDVNAHLKKLISDSHDARACFFGEDEVREGYEKAEEQINLLSLARQIEKR